MCTMVDSGKQECQRTVYIMNKEKMNGNLEVVLANKPTVECLTQKRVTKKESYIKTGRLIEQIFWSLIKFHKLILRSLSQLTDPH